MRLFVLQPRNPGGDVGVVIYGGCDHRKGGNARGATSALRRRGSRTARARRLAQRRRESAAVVFSVLSTRLVIFGHSRRGYRSTVTGDARTTHKSRRVVSRGSPRNDTAGRDGRLQCIYFLQFLALSFFFLEHGAFSVPNRLRHTRVPPP